MKLELKDGSTIAVTFDQKGRIQSASKALTLDGHTGFIAVDFLSKTLARETCVSPSQGFSSVKLYENNTLLRETCTDSWHKKAFCYAYDTQGHIMETLIQSLGSPDKEQRARRASVSHNPIDSLFQQLSQEPLLILPGKNLFSYRPQGGRVRNAA